MIILLEREKNYINDFKYLINHSIFQYKTHQHQN